MFDENPLDTLPIDTSDAISTNWDPFMFNDQSLNVPPTEFADYTFPTETVPTDTGYALQSLSGPEYGPQATDFNFTNPVPTAQDDVVAGLPNETSDSQSVLTGSDANGLSNAFGSLWKSITSKPVAAKTTGNVPSSQGGAKSAIDAVGSLVKNVTQTVRIVKDTQTRLTEKPGDKNAAVKRTNYLNKGASSGLRSGPAPGYGQDWTKIALIGAAIFVGFLILKKA